MKENERYRWIKEARGKETPPSSAPLESPRSPKHSIPWPSLDTPQLLAGHACHFPDHDGPVAARALAAALACLTGLTRLELRHNESFGAKQALWPKQQPAGPGMGAIPGLSAAPAAPREGVWQRLAAHCMTTLPECSTRASPIVRRPHPHNQMGDCSEIASALPPAHSSLTALTLLDLSYNDLDVGVAAAMAPGLRQLSRLCQLSLQCGRRDCVAW